MSEDLVAISLLLRERAEIEHKIAKLIGRPAYAGHIGEYIAAALFDISLHPAANHQGSDGRFNSGMLAGKSVNIKLYSKQTGILDIVGTSEASSHPDTYLVMVGGRASSLTSKGTSAPVSIEAIYLFDSNALVSELAKRGVGLGVATSVRAGDWRNAMVYPDPVNPALVLSDDQRSLVKLFTQISDTQN